MLVDDEQMVLTSLEAFLTLESDFQVHTFLSPEEALRHIEVKPVDVIVSDYLMPKMNGMQFLTKTREYQPEAARVLLTGHADKQSAITAINAVALFQYLEKPWDNAQLLLVLKAAIERTQILRELKARVADLDSAQDTLKDVQVKLLKAFL